MVTWEAVQKENYLSKLEKQRKDSKEEVLRKTAHRYTGALRAPRSPPPPGLETRDCIPHPTGHQEGLARRAGEVPAEGGPDPEWGT